jgi:uncharacterized membrane protein
MGDVAERAPAGWVLGVVPKRAVSAARSGSEDCWTWAGTVCAGAGLVHRYGRFSVVEASRCQLRVQIFPHQG